MPELWLKIVTSFNRVLDVIGAVLFMVLIRGRCTSCKLNLALLRQRLQMGGQMASRFGASKYSICLLHSR
jgi:hypothetical protein